ncbi:MAG: hypothetical protein IPK82_29570 [Polyangiaceae bacterium]|nr:hypothetical protein [Polyangiaceae bacterium]
MGFMPAPTRIKKTQEEMDAEQEVWGRTISRPPGDPHQVNPFKPNPNLYARYQIFQFDCEVGWVYVIGESATRCREHWQLYTPHITGAGESLPSQPIAPRRAAYTWPSQDDFIGEARNVNIQIVYRDSTDAVRPPANAGTGDYEAITSTCTAG